MRGENYSPLTPHPSLPHPLAHLQMPATNRTDKVKLLVKTLHKRYKHLPKPADRNLLECLMFAACLENATFDAAESAYSVLEHHYIDWNELRVSTSQEIADTLPMLPRPLAAGERIKKTLQWVFETTYMFDLEDYRKKTIGQTVEYLDSIPSCTPFMTGYLVQIGLGGHQIPFDEAALRIMRRLDLTKVNNGREEVPSIERFVVKAKGLEFATMMHLFGTEFFDRQDDAELLALLAAIDKNAAERSWQEPEDIAKKPDTKPIQPIPVKTTTPRSAGVKAEINLDDEDAETVGQVTREVEVGFVDIDLDALSTGDGVQAASPKGKKQTQSKPESKKASSAQTTLWKQDDEETAQKVVPDAVSNPSHDRVPLKKEISDDKKAEVSDTKTTDSPKPEKKATLVTKKPETKKALPQKKDVTEKETVKKDAKSTSPPSKVPPKTDKKKAESKPPQKPTKTSPPKSATKKLQQKKPR